MSKPNLNLRILLEDLIEVNESIGGNSLIRKHILDLKIFLIESKNYNVKKIFSTKSMDPIAYVIVDNFGNEGKRFTPEEFLDRDFFEGVGVL